MHASQLRWLLIALVASLLLVIWLKPLDAMSQRQVESGLQRALVTHAAARGLNGILSTVQSASISVGVGVGTAVHPGAILEPIDDLVEQFSALMLAASISYAIQFFLIGFFGAWPIALTLTLALLIALWAQQQSWSSADWLLRLALVLLCLRLAVPAFALFSEATYRLLLVQPYESSQAVLSDSELANVETTADEGITNRISRWWAQGAYIGEKIESIKAKADDLVVHMVRLAAIFIVQTVILPLLFLALASWLYRSLFWNSIHAKQGLDPARGRVRSQGEDSARNPGDAPTSA